MTYVVQAVWTAREGEEDAVAGILRALTPLSRAEPGNLSYEAHVCADDPRRFMIFERYADEAAFAAHRDSEHFRRLVVGDCLARLASREVTAYRPLDL
ncbi:putative quinol monooxygenase [Nonomuraea pusilla]|uniref:Quinol monooxygenase YgiN n=1 Tax=Nonomuraea pusilla TaxID=46177 RepID=A0A1H8FQJ3_9ACTN|nr:putative quinol monooxygenase [Nonomuraea pusilla]SEN34071.1 Quinol monooxygenase YgiN [Nonomuraea pusilla]